jgi:hypothetical protein
MYIIYIIYIVSNSAMQVSGLPSIMVYYTMNISMISREQMGRSQDIAKYQWWVNHNYTGRIHYHLFLEGIFHGI